MKIGTRLFAAAAAVALSTGWAQAQQWSDGVIKLGVMNDMSSLYADLTGIGSVIAARMAPAVTISVTGSTSTNTGVAPSRATDPAVAKNENVGVMTSSPGPTPSAIIETSSASVPDDTPIACRTPIACATSRSNASTSGPRMNCCDSQTLAIADWISSRIEAY